MDEVPVATSPALDREPDLVIFVKHKALMATKADVPDGEIVYQPCGADRVDKTLSKVVDSGSEL